MTESQITPRLEIDLAKIRHNSAELCARLGARGIRVTGVSKAALGDPAIATAMLAGGVRSIGDSRIENIRRMREAGVDAQFMLLRSPQISRVEEVVRFAHISLNSELEVIERLSEAAQRQRRLHRTLLMVELGDLREGFRLEDLEDVIERCLRLPNIRIEGIGTNLTCLSGVKPDAIKMGALSDAARALQAKFGLQLETVSGGNSATLEWAFQAGDCGAVNNLRLGEAILLGRETLHRQPIAGLYEDAITLVADVIEAKVKPSVPDGEIAQNAFGSVPTFVQRGDIQRSILGIGHQDTLIDGITPEAAELAVIGASSDHLILDSSRSPLAVGAQVRFRLNYGALLAAMTSPFVGKVVLAGDERSSHRQRATIASSSQ